MIRVLLVDDELPARDRLRRLLDDFEDVHIVGEADNGQQALESVSAAHPDLVFLDIQMPGLTGLEVAASLSPPRPELIFCTAFDQYAIQAFEQQAVDYLLKPVKRERLQRALERVRETIVERKNLRREIDVARQVQERFFPQILPPMKSLQYAGICKTAAGVGGDYYDFLPVGPDKLGIALGDVSGKGIYAGLLMAGLQGQLQSYAPLMGEKVADLVSTINRRMCATSDDSKYATFFYGLYDDSRQVLNYVNAGHLPPLILSRSRSRPIRLDKGGTVMGLFSDASYEQDRVQMEAGDILVVYSDGLSEATNEQGEEFGEDRLIRLVAENAQLPVEQMRDLIVGKVQEFTAGQGHHDDLTLVMAKVQA